jgi:ADP-heptose:LPS heptosyltransferase
MPPNLKALGMPIRARKILVIRRDNIGDLVCTTPLLTALRQAYPEAHIHALVNSYNAPVLAGHPALDALHTYTKLKHVDGTQSRLGAALARLKLAWQLRLEGFDLAIVAPPGARLDGLSRWALQGAVMLEGAPIDEAQGRHHVEEVFSLLAPLGIGGVPPPVSVATTYRTARTQDQRQTTVLAVHISARKPSQCWPDTRYVELIEHTLANTNWQVHLFWSPGARDDPLHPGDDLRAEAILRTFAASPLAARLLPQPTQSLSALIAGLSQSHVVFCSDGGAMHVAAGLGKPIACLFGQSNATRWRPWGVPHVVLQTESRDAADVPLSAAVAALDSISV